MCAPENFEDYHMGELITGVCENERCENPDYPADQVPIRSYALRESCGGEA
jgi:hypothetical protein